MTEDIGAPQPHWQCLMIAWGEKYGVADVNRIVAAVRAQSSPAPRFVLISDRPRPGLDPSVIIRPYPDWWLQPRLRTGGCQAKLAMFEPGTIPDDLPVVFLDLDTAVLGDLSQAIGMMRDRRSMLMLQSSVVPFGALARWLYRATGGKRYARGNSSVLVFHPAECAGIAARFRELDAAHPGFGFRPLISDERFISWVAQPHMRALPQWFAVKFPTEFMLPWPWLIHLRSAMPWVRRRRARLCAVTFPGGNLKAENLLNLPEGGRIVDKRGRLLLWTDRALGPVRRKVLAYYADLS